MTTVLMRSQAAGGTSDLNLPTVPRSSQWMGHAWTVYANAMEEGGNFLKSMFRLTSATTFWTKHFYPSAPSGVAELGGFAKQAKNLTSIISLPLSVERLASTLNKFDPKKPITSAANIGADVCALANNGCDTIEFVDAIVAPIPKEVTSHLKVVSYSATFFGSLKGSYDTASKLIKNVQGLFRNESDIESSGISRSAYLVQRTKGLQQLASNLLSLSAKVSYAALGAIGLASLVTPIGPVSIVGCMTAGTVLGLGSFFYDRVVDPFDDRAKKLSENPFFDRAVEIAAKRLA